MNACAPVVTIVTPAYNQGIFLEETINSVLAQNYRWLEYIVINDGSTDGTQEIIDSFGDRITSVSRGNRGQAATLNEGWSMAKGEFIGYLSSDDLLEPDAISRLVSTLVSDHDVIVAYGDYRLIDAAGTEMRVVRTEEFNRSRLINDLVCQPGPGALFRKSAISLAGGWDESLKQVPDFEFWTRVSRFGSFKRVSEVIASCRIHGSSASYRPLSKERCDEIITVVQASSYPADGEGRRTAIAKAHLVSGKRHISSARLAQGLRRWHFAFATSPRLMFSIGTWRMLGSALLRRLLYRIRGYVVTKESVS